MRQVEEALARQTLYGGDVVTNLLEVAPPPATDESALTAALAESLEIAPASVDALRAPDANVVARVPRNIAEENGFVPIAIRDGAIVVALAEPLGEAAMLDLRAMLGAEIVQEAAPFVRLRQALERAYGVPMDRRTRRLASILDGLDGTTESTPAEPRTRSAIPDLPDDPVLAARTAEPPAVTPTPSSAASTRPPPATTIRTQTAGADALKWFVKSARGDAPPEEKRRESTPRFSVPGGRRRRGPFTREDVDKIFIEPASTDAVLGAVLEFAQQWFAYVALFLVHEDLAEGWEASGPGAAGDRVRKMGVPLDLPSMFAATRDTRAPLVQPRLREGLDAVIATDLERPSEGDVLVAPVVVGKRVVALLYADDAGDAMSSVDTAQVLAVVANAGAALARMILKKKGKVPAKPFTPPPAAPRSVPSEVKAERAGALAEALKRGSPKTAQPAPKHTPVTGDRVRAASLEPIVAPAEPEKSQEEPTPVVLARKQTLPGMQRPKTVPPKSVPPESAPDSPTGIPLSGSGEVPALRDLEQEQETPVMALPEQLDDGVEEPPTPILQPRSAPKAFQPTGASAMPPPPALVGRRALGPVIPREEPESASSRRGATAPESPAPARDDRSSEPEIVETAQVTDDELEELLELADRSNIVEFDDHGRPSERFESYQPREPPRPLRRASEHELPKVIVAIEPEYVGLVGRVIRGGQGGEAASAELRRLGVAALPAIMDRFPGPTRVAHRRVSTGATSGWWQRTS